MMKSVNSVTEHNFEILYRKGIIETMRTIKRTSESGAVKPEITAEAAEFEQLSVGQKLLVIGRELKDFIDEREEKRINRGPILPLSTKNSLQSLVNLDLIDDLVDDATKIIDFEVDCWQKRLSPVNKKLISQYKLEEIQKIKQMTMGLIQETYNMSLTRERLDERKINRMRQLIEWIVYFNNPANQKVYDGKLTRDIAKLTKKKHRKEQRFQFAHRPIINAAQKVTGSNVFAGRMEAKRAKIGEMGDLLESKKIVSQIREYIQANDEIPRLFFVDRMIDFCEKYDLEPTKIIDRVSNQYFYRQEDRLKIDQVYRQEEGLICRNNPEISPAEIKVVLRDYYVTGTNKAIYQKVYDQFDWAKRCQEIFPWEGHKLGNEFSNGG